MGSPRGFLHTLDIDIVAFADTRQPHLEVIVWHDGHDDQYYGAILRRMACSMLGKNVRSTHDHSCGPYHTYA